MVVGRPTYYAITGGGLEVLPAVFGRLEHASTPQGRFYLQLCAKQVLRKDYLLRHPDMEYVAWVEHDHSAQMLAWWAGQDQAACVAGQYVLPSVMRPGPINGQFLPPSAEASEERLQQLRALGYVGQ